MNTLKKLPVLESLVKLEDKQEFIKFYIKDCDKNIIIHEAIAYSMCFIDTQGASESLSKLIDKLAKGSSILEWERKILDKGKLLLNSINIGNQFEILNSNKNKTLKNIGLGE